MTSKENIKRLREFAFKLGRQFGYLSPQDAMELIEHERRCLENPMLRFTKKLSHQATVKCAVDIIKNTN